MIAKPIRTYTASEVHGIVELFRASPDVSPEKFSGMEYLANILTYYESKTEGDIAAEVREFCHANPFFPFESSD